MVSEREEIDIFEIRWKYEVLGWTQQRIADYYGVSQTNIYYRLHPEKLKEYKQSEDGKAVIKRYSLSDKCKATRKRYRISDKGILYEQSSKRKKYKKEWRQTDKNKAYIKEWWQSENGKALKVRIIAERSSLGSIELNKPFPNSEGHHIDEEHIIHIPKELHRSISHNVWTGWNMEAINAIAFGYITEEMFDKLIAGEI